ncbi:MAG: PD-(D/E)XK nuclease family protein, partial [Thermoanaerobaculaceae bacterium]|nr:PD-(D/E)XK nuclease family protein [Thermoanaerobaculaceae bacterium]
LVRAAAERVLPARAVVVHGFAEATGLAADLLEAITLRCPTTTILDEPPDPADPTRPDLGVVFAARLRERLARHAPLEVWDETPPPASREVYAGVSVDDEVRWTAEQMRTLLDAGVCPERIGVVCRNLDEVAMEVERHFSRLGIPYSSEGASGSLLPVGRRLAALVEVLRRGEAVSVDAWLLAGGGEESAELGLALRACGAGKLAQLASLAVEPLLDGGGYLPLPLRRGLGEAPADGEDGPAPLLRQRLPGAVLREAVRRAQAWCQGAAAWPAQGELAVHVECWRRLAATGLGWSAGGGVDGSDPVEKALDQLSADVPPTVCLGREEFVELLAQELAQAGRAPLGGAGGGVQVLGVMQARARTFEHLFLLGLNRDLFPRPVREDPLLPDRLRGALALLLPDLPLKLAGLDEERYLFAQLVAASPRVALTLHATGGDGKPAAPSPLLLRLGLAGNWPPREEGGRRWLSTPATALEHAVAAGLAGERQHLAALLALARQEACPEGSVPAQVLGRVRAAILAEWDPDPRGAEGRVRRRALGPYFGFVGPRSALGDPRGELFASVAAGMVSCPWQTFLERLLGLADPPDPLAGVPAVDARLLGVLVHRVLEQVCRRAAPHLPRSLAEALSSQPVAVPWPEEDELDALLEEVSALTAREAGLLWPGFPLVLKEVARPYLGVAQACEWGRGAVAVCGVEVEGEASAVDGRGRPQSLRFRADRLDRCGDRVVFTDYKTGRPQDLGVKRDTRHDRLARGIASGHYLQAAAYALAEPRAGRGRYLYLAPDLEDAERVVELAGEEWVADTFCATVETVQGAWEEGVFFPRLVEPDRDTEPRKCSYCLVAPACLRGESGVRLRLREWVHSAARGGAGTASRPEELLISLWYLPKGGAGGSGEGEEGA